MNGSSLIIDTNIALYLLNGDQTLAELLNGLDIYVSFISELELLGYQGIEQTENEKIIGFLKECIIIDINQAIKELTIDLKQSHRIKLPDAIIAATSLYMNIPLISADSGFEKLTQIQFLKYEL